MEAEVKEYRVVKNNNVGNVKKVYKIIYIDCLDDVVEHERMGEDIEEYIVVMVYQERSMDVDVDKESDQ